MNEVLRQEKKFLISTEQYYRLSSDFDQILSQDSHNGKDGYTIRSLYFDTLDDKDFEEKEEGVEVRRKIRLRTYSADADFAVLEMKQKQGAMQKKRSLTLKREDAARLCEGNYSPLLAYSDPFAGECYALMNMMCYVPKAVVEYQRKAFIAKENKIRVTFDHHIIASECSHNIFHPYLLQYSVLNPALIILEVKYNGFLLSYIKDVIDHCNASELSVGKYSLSRTISKHYRF